MGLCLIILLIPLLPLFFPYSIIHAWFPELLTYLHPWVPACRAPSLTVYLVASIPPSRPNSQMTSLEPFLNAVGRYKLEIFFFLMHISLSLCLRVLCLYLSNILLWFYWSFVIVSAPLHQVFWEQGPSLIHFCVNKCLLNVRMSSVICCINMISPILSIKSSLSVLCYNTVWSGLYFPHIQCVKCYSPAGDGLRKEVLNEEIARLCGENTRYKARKRAKCESWWSWKTGWWEGAEAEDEAELCGMCVTTLFLTSVPEILTVSLTLWLCTTPLCGVL